MKYNIFTIYYKQRFWFIIRAKLIKKFIMENYKILGTYKYRFLDELKTSYVHRLSCGTSMKHLSNHLVPPHFDSSRGSTPSAWCTASSYRILWSGLMQRLSHGRCFGSWPSHPKTTSSRRQVLLPMGRTRGTSAYNVLLVWCLLWKSDNPLRCHLISRQWTDSFDLEVHPTIYFWLILDHRESWSAT